MTVKDSHSLSSSGTFKPQKSPYVLILVFIYLSSQTGKAFHSIFFKYSISVQIALHYSNSFSSFIRKGINLLFVSLSPSLTLGVLGVIKTNGLIAFSKYRIKYLELVSV